MRLHKKRGHFWLARIQSGFITSWTGTTFCGPGASRSGRGKEEKRVKDKGKVALTSLLTTTECWD
ncbi:hypothetical protein PO909_009251 [Leuciscus waleckii]